MADKEFTQICKEILAAAQKISPLAEQAGKLVERMEQEKSKLQAVISEAKEAIKQALQGANEQATQTLSAAQTQAEQTAKLAKEATEQNAADAKSAQQKAAEILASIEKLQEQIKAAADKVENAGALLAELNSLKEQIKTLLQNGIINDTAQSATQTYSSNLIERKLATKTSAGYGYSKSEANAKFEALAQGINTAISAAAAAKSSADGKLGKDEQAADSAKLGGAAADKYMNIDKYNPTAASSPNTLALRDENGDFKGRKVTAGNFLTTEKAQDDAIDEHSEICYRAAQSSEADPKQMRFATLGKMKSALEIDQKLGKNDKAADSAKLGGVEGGNFHRKDGANGSKITTITSLEVDLTQGDNFVLNLSAPGTLALKNGTVGQSGALIVRNATNITGYDAALGFRATPTGLGATEVFAYFVVDQNEIKMGRV